MQRKAVARVEVKDAEQGIVTARFATLGVVDLEGDIIEPGAIGQQDVKVSAYGHASWQGALPPGVGRTYERGNEALAVLSFFMDTAHGRDHFETIKGLGELAEYSFGFDIEDAADPSQDQRAKGARRVLKKLKVHEVSPVLRGAGVGTGTVAVKCDGCGVDVGKEELCRAARKRNRIGWMLAGRGPGPGDPDFFRQSDGEAEALAKFAVTVGHRILGCPGKVRSPDLAWIPPRQSRKGLRGYVLPRRHAIWLAMDLSGRELVRTALHECVHLAQDAAGKKFTEPEADAFADEWTGAVYAAYRWSGGDSWRVLKRRTGPPWYDDEHNVILYRGKAWTHHRNNKGNPWTSHS